MGDNAKASEYPLPVLLEVFASLQKKGLPLMLVLAGLPTLFPRLVETRTYAERMFTTIFLDRLTASESTEAIKKPIEPHELSTKTRSETSKTANGLPSCGSHGLSP